MVNSKEQWFCRTLVSVRTQGIRDKGGSTWSCSATANVVVDGVAALQTFFTFCYYLKGRYICHILYSFVYVIL
jgi:hypothetical protein